MKRIVVLLLVLGWSGTVGAENDVSYRLGYGSGFVFSDATVVYDGPVINNTLRLTHRVSERFLYLRFFQQADLDKLDERTSADRFEWGLGGGSRYPWFQVDVGCSYTDKMLKGSSDVLNPYLEIAVKKLEKGPHSLIPFLKMNYYRYLERDDHSFYVTPGVRHNWKLRKDFTLNQGLSMTNSWVSHSPNRILVVRYDLGFSWKYVPKDPSLFKKMVVSSQFSFYEPVLEKGFDRPTLYIARMNVDFSW